MSVDNVERVSDAVRRRLESRSSVFQPSSERGQLLIRTGSFKCVWHLVRTCLASRWNAFSFSVEPAWLFIRTPFGFSFERDWLFVRRHFIPRPNASRLWSERVPTSYQTCSNETPSGFERDAKRVRTRRQMHLNDPVRMSNLNETPNAFLQHPKLVQSYPLTLLIND